MSNPNRHHSSTSPSAGHPQRVRRSAPIQYFAPIEHHRPETLDELTARNALELFDLQVDPDEANNLAADPASAADTILEMNTLLNRLIDEEVGVDDGSFLPTGTEKAWEVECWDV